MHRPTNSSVWSHLFPCLNRGLWLLVLVAGLVLSFGQSRVSAQTYQMNSVNGQTISTTSGTFYDSGGVSSGYNNSETYTVTFNSGTSDKIRLTFSSFSTELGFDYLYIYDGTSTAAAQVAGSPFSGTTLPGTITSTASSLTVKFVSDGSVTSTGWAATISSILASDYGDYNAFGAASATASSVLFLGTNATDIESSNPANSTATGDDSSGTNDEDLTIPAMTAGATSSFTVPVFNNSGTTAYLSVWIDFNNNGSLTDSGEKVVNSVAISSSASTQNLVLSIPIPATATTSTPLGIRYRLDSVTGVAATGIGGAGEVEDYLSTISPPTLDFGDFSGFGNAASTASNNLRMGATVDAEGSATKNSTATGDDITGSDDEDGVTMPASIVAGLSSTFTVNVTNTSGEPAYLNAWIDFNNNGLLTDSGEQIASNVSIADGTSGANQAITFTVPASATQTTVGVRFRLTSTLSPGPTGTSGVGEVEDYVVLILPSMTLGNLVWNDVNNNGIKDATEVGIGGATLQLYSSGADNTVNTADDVLTATTTTGVTGAYSFSSLAPGKYYVKLTPPTAYPKTSGTPVTTDNDVDNNNDGSQPGGVNTAIYSPIITLTANGESVTDGDTDANTNMTVDFGLFTGFTVGNLVFNDVNNNGVQDAGELGISGLTVELLDSAGASFSPAVTTTTNSSGQYSFTVYSPGTYKIKVTPNATYPLSSAVVGTDNATDNNNDGTQPGGKGTASTSFAFALTAVGEPGTAGATNVENTIDFGFLACPTITITPSSLTAAVVATAYTQSTAFSASGGTSPYTWTVSALPTGMSWDSANLKFSGTPLFSGTTNVTLTATDAKGCASTITVPFQVCSTPVISSTGLTGATVGAAYNASATATEAGFDLQQAFSSTQITSLATADALLAGTNRLSNWTGVGAVVNFASSGGGDGNFVGTVFPAGAGDDFSLKATGTITIPTTGTWTFGINSDDGCRLKIDSTTVISTDAQRSAADTFGQISLTAGTHTIDAEFFERAGGESFELYAASGAKSSFSTSFKLVGGSGGLTVVRSTNVYTWAVTSGSLPPGLSLNTSTGAITGIATTPGSYTFTLSATDGTGCVGTKSVTMTAACPTLTMTPATSALNQGTVGTGYSQALSSSGSFGTVTWTVSSGTLPAGLTLNSSTGVISGTPTAPTAGTTGTSIAVTASDQYGCSVTQNYTLKICPVISLSPSSLTVPVVGTAYSQTISASNGTSPYTFAVSSGTPPSGLSLSASGVLSGTPSSATSATFTVQATDAYGCVGTLSYTVLPVCPAFTITPSTMAVGTTGSAYSQALNVTGGTAPYTWSLQSGTLPAGLSLASSSGILSGTPTASNGAGTALTFKATDVYGCAATMSYTLKICPIITVTPASLITGTVGSAYTASMSSSGGATPITYAVTAGSLPAGLSMSTAGVISGIPTASNGAGTSFTVTATDANGCPGSVVTTLKICPVITLTPATLPTATVGSAYSQNITANNGASPYAYSISTGTLPTGLTLTSAGVLSGTPTNTTSQTFSILAVDANGCPGSVTYTLAPVCPTITITPSSMASGLVGTNYTQTLTASGGTPAYSWSLKSGTLPAGLSLSPSTGIVSGTPTSSNGAGTALTFQVADLYGCSATITYTLKICSVITVTPASLVTGTVGTPYSASMSSSGGATPVTYSVTAGSLPAGLSMSTAGVISGTPTTSNGAGTSFTVTATDAKGCTGSVVTALKICPVITLAPLSLPTPTVGFSYSQTLTASNGASPYVFSTTVGSLPTGLSLSSSGVLSGTPTNTTAQTFTVQAIDVNNCAVSMSYTLAPVCPAIGITPVSIPSGTVGVPFSQTLTAAGGSPSYTWSLQSGTLPAGLSLDTAAGTISGTPTSSNGAGVVLTFMATDIYGCTGTVTYTLKICPVINVTPSTVPVGTVGTAYSVTFTSTAGVSPMNYSVTSGTLPAGLTLNSASGLLSGTPTAANGAGTSLTITARDANNCTGTVTVNLKICPVIGFSPTTLAVPLVGKAYSATITAGNGVAPYTFAVTTGVLPSGLSLSSAGAFSGIPTNTTSQTFTVTATDANACVGTITYTLAPICPTFTMTPASLANGTVGGAYAQNLGASGGTAPYTWTLVSGTIPAGLSLSGSVLSGTPTTANGTGISLTFRATDSYLCTGTVTYNLKICPPVSVSPSTLATPIVGSSYSQTITATGGVAPYTYSKSSGTLPTGLTFSTGGVLSGISTSTTPGTFTLKATDANGCSGTLSYTVTPVCPTITLTPATIPFGTVGTAYSQTLSASGGNSPYTWSVQTGTLPAGLSLSTSGVISGTPTASNGAGTSLTFKATDVYGCAMTITYTLKICPVLTLGPAVLTQGLVGSSYTGTLVASGGASPYSYSITGGSLPAGLSLNSSTGIVSGTPSASNGAGVTINFSAADVNGCPGTGSTLIQICPVITIAPTTLVTPTVGFAYAQSITASGGLAPYAYSVTSGTLPAGLVLGTDGVLSGVASSTATQTFTVTAVDANGCPSSRSYTVTPVCPTVTLSPATIPYGTVGTPYSQSFAASGGNSPVTWTVQTGTIPAGLSLSPAGVLSGTPTVSNGAGTSITLASTDPYGCVTTITYNLKICPIITLSPAVLPYGTVGSAYNSSVTQSGGALPTTFAVTGGVLPAGLSMNASTGAITGTPTTSNGPGVTVTFTATDANGCPGTINSLFKICPVITIAPGTLATPVIGYNYSQTLTASNGAAPYVWSVASGSLPTGLSLSSSGIMTGVAVSTASATFTLQAVDVNGCPALRTFTVTPVCPTVLIAPATVPAGTVGTPYSQTLSASGGTAPYTFTLQSGSLPTGLTLDGSTGIISGTPTTSNGAGVVVQFKATDVYGCSGTLNFTGTANYTMKICPIITVSPASGTLPTGTLGVPYSQTLTASGGAGSYTWSVASGSLPNGLTLSSSGVISGTPTVVSSFNFTAKALDANGCPGTSFYTLPVQCPPITMSPASLADGTLGIGYNQTLTASGGTAPYTWAVTGGTLPAGLTLNASTGVISGVPTATNGAGVNVTFTATDSNPNACTAVKSYKMKICPVITISPATLPPLTVGVSYTQALSGSGGSGPYVFSLFNGNLPPWASLDTTSGVISGVPTDTTSYTFVIQATDSNGCPGLRSYNVAPSCPVVSVSPTSLTVPVVGVPYTATLSGVGGSSPYSFRVTSGSLPSWASLNSSTGVISGLPNNTTSFTFTVQGTDAYGCLGSLSYTLAAVCPAITMGPSSLANGTVGVSYSQVMTASGGAAPYTYSLSSGTLPAGLSLSAASGQISGVPTAPTSGVSGTRLVIVATDAYGCQAALTLNLKICPVLTFTPATLPTGTVGTPYTQNVIASGGTGPYSYSLSSGTLPAGLTLNSAGLITGTPSSSVSSNITISVTDANGCPGSVSYVLATSCPVITISPGTLPSATQGISYSASLSASGGTAPYTWGVIAGSLPSGLSLSSAGLLSGTPTTGNGAGTSVTFQARDNFGCVATATFNVKVCAVITFQQSSLASGTVSAFYSQQITAQSGTAPYTYSVVSGTLPGGLTLNSSSGIISGTPTAGNGSGTSFTVQALDINGCSGTKAYTLKICPLIQVSPSFLPIPQVGTPYNQTLSATGGVGPYTFSVTTGTLPAWAALNSVSGVVSGTPNTTVGAAFTVTAVDANGCTGSQVYNFTPVCPTITVGPGAIASGTVNTPYSQTLTATGGSSPYVWALTSGTLPSGLSLSSGGIISGTPTASNGAGTSITVRATDNLGCVASKTFNLRVCPVITIGPSSLTAFTVGSPYTQTFAASGGQAPYTYAVVNGAMPSWASLNLSTGVISGTPTNNAPAAFSVVATDANGCQGSRSYSLIVLSLNVGNLVWNDANNNGIRDAGENGIANVRVELWSAGTNGVEENGGGDDVKMASDVFTDANGNYLFSGLTPGSNYYIRIPVLPPTNAVTSGVPVNLDNGVDNDNNGLQPGGPGTPVRTPLFAIYPGTEPDVAVDGDDANSDLTMDIGLAPTISVGNLVFKDVDNSGTYDSSIDAPLDGVKLQLFAQGADPLSGSPIATTTSANGGLYLFSVRAGNYFVYVPASQFASTGVLYGMKPARGRTDNTVPNIDDNGDQNALATSKPIATGVRTGVFTLAAGVMPTAASGENGYLSSSDNSFDSDANLTVDLGFYPIPVVTAPLAGRVTRDLAGTGDPFTNTTAIPGVQVSLYEDLNANGKLDADEMTAIATKFTDATGAFSFEDVPAGDYLVVQTILPGAEATFDSDGGDASVTAITIEGDPVVDVNFLQSLAPDTFKQWQQFHLGMSNSTGDDPDGDLESNLIEYALGTDAGSGSEHSHFWLELNSQGTADALVVRNATGHRDIIYQLEGSADLATWARINTPPSSVVRLVGTEQLRYGGITSRFVRLKVLLDANLDGVPEASATTQIFGWSMRRFEVGSQTFSMPLLKPEVYAGPVSGANVGALTSGKSYYAEVTSGPREGQRFEVNVANSSSRGLAFDGSSPEAGDNIALRAHWTLVDLFPTSLFHGGLASSTTDRIMFFNGTGYDVYWLMTRAGSSHWVRSGDATLADAGGRIVGPMDGVMINVRTTAISARFVGAVRSWKSGLPLRSGAQLTGSGYPISLSPIDMGMTIASGFTDGDALRLWQGDSTNATGYDAFTLKQNVWTAADGHDASAEKVFDAWHAVWVISTQGNSGWSPAVPWKR